MSSYIHTLFYYYKMFVYLGLFGNAVKHAVHCSVSIQQVFITDRLWPMVLAPHGENLIDFGVRRVTPGAG